MLNPSNNNLPRHARDCPVVGIERHLFAWKRAGGIRLSGSTPVSSSCGPLRLCSPVMSETWVRIPHGSNAVRLVV